MTPNGCFSPQIWLTLTSPVTSHWYRMQRGPTEDNRPTGRKKNDEIKQKDSEQETKILLKTPLYNNHLKWGRHQWFSRWAGKSFTTQPTPAAQYILNFKLILKIPPLLRILGQVLLLSASFSHFFQRTPLIPICGLHQASPLVPRWDRHEHLAHCFSLTLFHFLSSVTSLLTFKARGHKNHDHHQWYFSIANLQVLRQKSASLCWMNDVDFSLYCHWRDRKECVFCFGLYPPFEVWALTAYSEIWKVKSCRIQAVASKSFCIWTLRGVTSWNQQLHNLLYSLINQERKQFGMSGGKQITILRYWGKESSLVQSMLELETGNRGTATEER